jgi:Ricin-type beta-trefoil lectin domain
MRFFLRRARLLAGAALATAAVAAVPAAASAQSLQNVAISTEVSANSLVLDVAGGSTDNGGGVIQWYGSFAGNQRWNLVDQGDGTETIVNQNSGKCLTTDGVAGHEIYQFTCVGSPLRKWQGTLRQQFDGKTDLVNRASRLALDISGGNHWAGGKLIGWPQNDQDNQKFRYYQLF